MEYGDYQGYFKVMSKDGEPVAEFKTWRADFIEEVSAAVNKIGMKFELSKSEIVEIRIEPNISDGGQPSLD